MPVGAGNDRNRFVIPDLIGNLNLIENLNLIVIPDLIGNLSLIGNLRPFGGLHLFLHGLLEPGEGTGLLFLLLGFFLFCGLVRIGRQYVREPAACKEQPEDYKDCKYAECKKAAYEVVQEGYHDIAATASQATAEGGVKAGKLRDECKYEGCHKGSGNREQEHPDY